MSSTYADVDASLDPSEAVAWQRRVDRWPAIQAYKRRVREVCAGLDRVLDVGCGPGDDIASGGCFGVGIDPSDAMCRTAPEGAVVCRGDGHALPFATESFGAVGIDRVLQHVERPEVVLGEMARVLRPGGRLAVADPDQQTLSVHVPGVRQELVDRVRRLRRDVGYRNGRLISQVPAVLTAWGFTDVTIDGFVLTLTDPDEAFGLPTWVDFWRDEGGFTDDEEAEWRAGVARGRRAGFVYALTYFVVAATKP